MAKYYNIAEVSEILSISKTNLRYLETTIKRFKLKKIRGRRYYTENNIEQLKAKLEEKGFDIGQLDLFKAEPNKEIQIEDKALKTNPAHKSIEDKKPEEKPDSKILDKIDNLEQKFKDLQERLKAA